VYRLWAAEAAVPIAVVLEVILVTTPRFSVPGAAASVAENVTGTVYKAATTDADSDALTYSLSGADAALFTIGNAISALSFVRAPNYENLLDADHDNVYEVTVIVSDGKATFTKAISVTVTNVAGAVSTRRVATGFDTPPAGGWFRQGAGGPEGRAGACARSAGRHDRHGALP
jgi:hypothetical protein